MQSFGYPVTIPSARRSRSDSRCFALGIAFATVFVIAGCDSSPPLYPVSGQVLIDGSPATKGSVRFVPDSGRAATAKIGAQGQFRLASHTVGGQHEGVLPGRYRVAVSSNEAVDAETARWLAPAKYADHRTSGLEVNVDGPLQDLKFDLTWEGVDRDVEPANDGEATADETDNTSTPTATHDAAAAVK